MKIMKKNKMMRAASVLLVAVLLTTSIISGTFAKYVTQGSASDSARVAKFGVVVAGNGSLFDHTYYSVEEEDSNEPGGQELDSTPFTSLTVESQSEDNVVAPGTKSDDDGLSLTVSGTPEVDVYVKYGIDITSDIYLKANTYSPDVTNFDSEEPIVIGEDYYPIEYTLSGDILKNVTALTTLTSGGTAGTYDSSNGTFKGTLAQVKAAVEALNGGADGKGVRFDAGTNLATSAATGLKLTWAWDFDASGVGTNDKADTILGDIAAGTPTIQKGTDEKSAIVDVTDYETDVSLKFTVSVTQID